MLVFLIFTGVCSNQIKFDRPVMARKNQFICNSCYIRVWTSVQVTAIANILYKSVSEEDDDDDSVNYSPVCSETEDMEVQDSASNLKPHLSPQDFEDSDNDCGKRPL